MTEEIYGTPATRDIRGERVLHATAEDLLKITAEAKADGFVSCIDLTATDYLTHPGRSDLPPSVSPQRFELVVTLISHSERCRQRIRVQISEDKPQAPSLFDLYPGVEALEREVFDMYGIVFINHPNMTRILMPETWEGYPLRKDFAVGAVPVQFKAREQE